MIAFRKAMALGALVACARQEPSATVAPDAAASEDAGARKESAAPRPAYEPCALLPPSALVASFPETAGMRFAARDATTPTKTSLLDAVEERDARGFGITCSYEFPKKDARAVDARAQAKRRAIVLERVEARKRADGGALPRLSETLAAVEQPRVRVVLTMATKTPFASAAGARAAFDARMAGRDAGIDGVNDAGALPGADDSSFDRGVLQVLAGPHLFSLEVAAEPATDEAKTRTLAAHVVAALSGMLHDR